MLTEPLFEKVGKKESICTTMYSMYSTICTQLGHKKRIR